MIFIDNACFGYGYLDAQKHTYKSYILLRKVLFIIVVTHFRFETQVCQRQNHHIFYAQFK